MNPKLFELIKNLQLWIETNGYSSYDPYDIKDVKLVRIITDLGNKNKVFEAIREGFFELFRMFPLISRKLLFVEKKINPKGMGLLASAYLNMHLLYPSENYLLKGKEILAWLEANYNKNYPGMGWGYPFNWQSKELIPKDTPNGIVTTAVGNAFWDFYNYTGNKKYLDICEKICQFLISLPIDRINNEEICFSYTPVYMNHVHNLNLFVCEFLLKVGRKLGKKEYIEIALKGINYTIKNQREDGSFDYNGPPDKPRNFVDNYHTGFVLRCLHSIYKLEKNEAVFQSLKKGYKFYLENFFQENKIPKLLPNRLYRIDIHSCSESILCLSTLSDLFPEGIQIAKNVMEWTIENLLLDDGSFIHGIFKSKLFGIKYKSRISYLRWGQSWMLLALSTFALKVKENVN